MVQFTILRSKFSIHCSVSFTYSTSTSCSSDICLFEYLEGKTTGQESFVGEISKQLPGCDKLPVVHNEPIETEDINIAKNDLIQDKKHLLDIIRAIQTEDSTPDLAAKDPGRLTYSDG